jgi:hypothetical protein
MPGGDLLLQLHDLALAPSGGLVVNARLHGVSGGPLLRRIDKAAKAIKA